MEYINDLRASFNQLLQLFVPQKDGGLLEGWCVWLKNRYLIVMSKSGDHTSHLDIFIDINLTTFLRLAYGSHLAQTTPSVGIPTGFVYENPTEASSDFQDHTKFLIKSKSVSTPRCYC